MKLKSQSLNDTMSPFWGGLAARRHISEPKHCTRQSRRRVLRQWQEQDLPRYRDCFFHLTLSSFKRITALIVAGKTKRICKRIDVGEEVLLFLLLLPARV